jgi:hypothetical protein
MRGKPKASALCRDFGRNLCREDLLRHAGRVFALVVEDLVLGDDLTHGQRATVEDPNRQLAARDKGLQHHLVVVLLGQSHGRLELLRLLYHSEAHCGALLRRLDDHGPAQLPPGVIGTDRAHQPVGRRHARGAKQTLADVLIHSHCARHRPASSIRHAHDLEHRLNRAILPPASVEAEEDHIGIADDRK